MKKTKLLGLSLALVSFSLMGCQKKVEPTPEPEGGTVVPVVDKYTKETESYSDKPLAITTKVRFHYHRKGDDGSLSEYVKWTIWIWDTANGGNGNRYDFATYDDYGVILDVDLATVAAQGHTTTSQIGFIVSTVNWTKDIDQDRYIDIKEQSPGGCQEVYLYQGKSKIYDSAEATQLSTLVGARFESLSKVAFTVLPADDFEFDASRVKVEIDGVETTAFSVGAYASRQGSITLNSPMDIRSTLKIKYEFSDSYSDEVTAVMTSYFDTEEFVNGYTYTGQDLGVTFDDENNPTKTTFKLWAPTSKEVTLNIYNSSDYRVDETKVKEVKMSYGEKGVYSTTIDEDLSGKYYTYTIVNSKGCNEVVDPYAKSAGLNGRRGMVANFAKINAEVDGWDEDVRPEFGEHSYGAEAIIYEIHIRDMTINPNSGVSEANRGKFLGLTEEGKTYTDQTSGVTVTTGLDHLEELGITHVQIQPFYDYSSVDESFDNKEMSDTNYNWGYDPLNFNCLEGSYSTDPVDGEVRVKEFKQMVMALHKKGINVNMDVVYNHTSGFDTQNFQRIVPNYYYRTSILGSPSNGSGCGNEFASNRYMGNKFIRESVKFFTSEYHLSGYRFDLMGLIDNQTMIDVYKDNKPLYENIMVYGEPWTGGDSPLESTTRADNLSNQRTVQASLNESFFVGDDVLVGAFNDQIRNGIKGNNGPSTGWIQGGDVGDPVKAGIKGMFRSSQSNVSPSQVINYVSCHDNYTLYDHLIQTTQGRDINDLYTQADTIVMTSFGVTFIQEGEDFMRTKKYEEDGQIKYDENSYKSSDHINNMDYALKAEKKEIFDFYKALLEFRKDSGLFSVNTRAEVNERLPGSVSVNGKNVSYSITANGETYLFIHAVSQATVNLSGEYSLVLSSKLDSTAVVDSSITLANNESVILKKA